MQPLAIAGIAVLVPLVLAVFKIPVKLIFRLLINTVLGLIVLFMINWLGGYIGLRVPVNWLGALVVGALGIPGVAVVLVLQFITGR